MRQQGFALNNGLSERGVLAIGHPILDADGVAVGALSIAMPSSRFEPTAVRPMVRALGEQGIEVEMRPEHGLPESLEELAAFDAVESLRRDGVPGLLVCSGSDEVTELAERVEAVVAEPA